MFHSGVESFDPVTCGGQPCTRAWDGGSRNDFFHLLECLLLLIYSTGILEASALLLYLPLPLDVFLELSLVLPCQVLMLFLKLGDQELLLDLLLLLDKE